MVCVAERDEQGIVMCLFMGQKGFALTRMSSHGDPRLPHNYSRVHLSSANSTWLSASVSIRNCTILHVVRLSRRVIYRVVSVCCTENKQRRSIQDMCRRHKQRSNHLSCQVHPCGVAVRGSVRARRPSQGCRVLCSGGSAASRAWHRAQSRQL